jgi:hypothetical protein
LIALFSVCAAVVFPPTGGDTTPSAVARLLQLEESASETTTMRE